MPQSDPVAFAAVGFDQIRESDCVSELVVSQIARLPAESRRRSHGGIGIRTTSSRAEYRSVAIELNHPNRCGCPLH